MQQVTLSVRTYIPANMQQRKANAVVEMLILQGKQVLDGAEFPAKKHKECLQFVQSLCAERGWQLA